METEIIEVPLTFDELLEDDYYKSEFEKRVQQRLEEYSHSDVKGGQTMDEVQKNEGELNEQNIAEAESQPSEVMPAPTDDPAVEPTDAVEEPAKEMTAQQFELYNETLRRVSKTATASLSGHYNAFEDAEVKAVVKQQVMAGENPNVKELAAGVVTRLAPQDEPQPEEKTEQQTASAEIADLKAEIALLKAGITPDRIDAAKRLFLAEGGDLGKVGEFVAKYPEWHKQEVGVVFTKAPPIAGKTAPTPDRRPVLNDFERKVLEARKRAGLE